MDTADLVELAAVRVRRQGVALVPEVADRILRRLLAALAQRTAGQLGEMLHLATDPQASLVRIWNQVDRSAYQEARGMSVDLAPRLATALLIELARLPAPDLALVILEHTPEPEIPVGDGTTLPISEAIRQSIGDLNQAAVDLYAACMAADADGELTERVDGALLDAMHTALASRGLLKDPQDKTAGTDPSDSDPAADIPAAGESAKQTKTQKQGKGGGKKQV